MILKEIWNKEDMITDEEAMTEKDINYDAKDEQENIKK